MANLDPNGGTGIFGRLKQMVLGSAQAAPSGNPAPVPNAWSNPPVPESAPTLPEGLAVDQMLDVWIDAWLRLVGELQATNGQIDTTMQARSRQAKHIAAANPGAAPPDLMDLMNPRGLHSFQGVRLRLWNAGADFRTFDSAWLSHLRAQETAWQKFGPTCDWSKAEVPNIAALAAIKTGTDETLVDFLNTMRSTKPSGKWLKSAKEIASGPLGATVRRAIVDWLATLPISGSPSARAKLWPDVTRYRNFRRRVVEATRQWGGPEPAALMSFFTYSAPFQIYSDGSGSFATGEPDPALLSEAASTLVRSAAWMLVHWQDAETVDALRTAAEATLFKVAVDRNVTNYRSLIVANACINALGEIATPDAVQALGRIKLKVRDERLSKQIGKAMDEAANQAGVTVADLQEIAVPTFDLDDVGIKVVSLGEFTATLRIVSTTDVEVELTRADGQAVKSVPAAVKADPAASAALKQLKDTAKSIEQALPVHRQRIESTYLTNRSWPVSVWRERFLDHPLMGSLGRRLIWTVTGADGAARTLMWHDGGLVDAQDSPAGDLAGDHVATLWHPIEATPEEAIAWRAFLMRHKLVQPFKQAHRELYPLTDAERHTETYSNRFASHILRQHQSVALARLRGWRATLRINADVPNDEPTHLRIPDYGLVGEFWTEKAGGDDAECTDGMAYVFISTDRVRFRQLLPAETVPGGMPGPNIRLDQIPPRLFSEVMRDVDLMVGVASIGNDPTWNDGGGNAQHPSQWRRGAAHDYWTRHSAAELEVAGQNRRQFLSELIPSLKIAGVCTLDDKYLTVRGKFRTYRIHLGSGNILMENDAYLCIVPKGPQGDSLDVHLPFEGDRMLSIILSKALMLAADDKIKDPSILSQLQRR